MAPRRESLDAVGGKTDRADARYPPEEPQEGASPAEAYGFVGFVLTGVLFFVYLFWAYVPDDTLRALGIEYYPDKYWALAIPTWIFALGFFVAWAYEGVNMMSVRATDDEDLIAETGGTIPTRLKTPDPKGSVPTIRDIPIEEVNRVLFRTPGGDRRVRRRGNAG